MAVAPGASLRRQVLGVLQAVRGIPGALDMHTVRVAVRTKTWSSGKIQTGTSKFAELVIGSPSPFGGAIVPPHVDGTYGDPEVTVGPIQPFDPVTSPRGFTPAQLNPGESPGVEYYYWITYPDGVGRPYVVMPRGLDTKNPLHYTVKLRTLDRKVPF